MLPTIPILTITLLLFPLSDTKDKLKPVQAERGHRLRINLDSTFNPNLVTLYMVIDSVSIAGEYVSTDHAQEEGKDRNGKIFSEDAGETEDYHAYVWPELAAGNYQLMMLSNFGWRSLFPVTISKDTFFKFPVEHQLNTEGIDARVLEHTDTIIIRFSVTGCFHHYEEEMRIYKNPEGEYILNLIRFNVYDSISASLIQEEKQYKLNPSIKQEIQLLIDSTTSLSKRSSGFYSTNVQDMYIQAGSNIFYFSDSGIRNWDLYYKFRLKYTKLTDW